MNKKEKPTASEYLAASVEEVVERANKSSTESEIPFVTALFSAKSNQDQKRASNKMFYVAVTTTILAAITLGLNYFSFKENAKKIEEITIIRGELTSQENIVVELKERISGMESTLDGLKSEREEYLKTIENIVKTIPHHEYAPSKHNNANTADVPTARAAD